MGLFTTKPRSIEEIEPLVDLREAEGWFGPVYLVGGRVPNFFDPLPEEKAFTFLKNVKSTETGVVIPADRLGLIHTERLRPASRAIAEIILPSVDDSQRNIYHIHVNGGEEMSYDTFAVRAISEVALHHLLGTEPPETPELAALLAEGSIDAIERQRQLVELLAAAKAVLEQNK